MKTKTIYILGGNFNNTTIYTVNGHKYGLVRFLDIFLIMFSLHTCKEYSWKWCRRSTALQIQIRDDKRMEMKGLAGHYQNGCSPHYMHIYG